MKTYHGYRQMRPGTAGDDPVTLRCTVRVIDESAELDYELPLRLDIRNKSPTGFEWGYDGSGPAQLALALVADVLRDDRDLPGVYQRVKRGLVNRFPKDGWTLTELELLEAIAQAKEEAGLAEEE
jgi:hypothetical protein